MEPRHVGLNYGGEQVPVQPRETQDGVSLEGDRFSAELTVEKQDPIPNLERESQPQQPPLVVPVLPAPLLVNDDSSPQSVVSDLADLAAGDEDLIEKVWVDKIKSIIAETKDDPYRREQEISKLQIEYIRKRYGREIGQTDG